ncbi:hypothetical protein LguiB_028517 [Lonicera macranthoides]
MQRQSLGSPTSKLHINGVGVAGAKKEENNLRVAEDQKRKESPSSHAAGEISDEERKSQKPQKSPSKPETVLIHLIPILTVLCFLILYLSSHDPSQKDLAQFNGFNRISKLIGIMPLRLSCFPLFFNKLFCYFRFAHCVLFVFISIDTKEIDDFGRILEVEKGDVLAIRSQRNLQEIDKSSRGHRVHRKIADF